MPNSTPHRNAHALPNGNRAPQERSRRESKTGGYISDARCRRLYLKAQGRMITDREHALFLEKHRAFLRDVFADTFLDGVIADHDPAADLTEDE
jgi:hypothetical protein